MRSASVEGAARLGRQLGRVTLLRSGFAPHLRIVHFLLPMLVLLDVGALLRPLGEGVGGLLRRGLMLVPGVGVLLLSAHGRAPFRRRWESHRNGGPTWGPVCWVAEDDDLRRADDPPWL